MMAADPKKLFLEAMAAINAGDYEGARQTLQKVNGLAPGNADVLSYLGFAEASMGMAEGLAKTAKAAEASPSSPQILMNHAFALSQAGQEPEATRVLEKANKITPGEAAILNQLTRLYVKAAEYDKALPELKRLLAITPKDPAVIERTLLAMVKAGKGEAALSFANSFQGQLPEGEFLWHLVARAARAAEDWRTAYKFYKKLDEKTPGNITYKRGLSHSLIGLENFAEVIPLLKEIQALDPANEGVIYSMAYALFNDNRHEECLPFAEIILEKDPEDIETLIIKGRSLIFFGEFEIAEEIFRKVLELSPDHPMAVMQLTKIKKPAPGDAIFNKLKEMEKTAADERNYRALMGFTLGEMYEGIGDFDQAFHYFNKGNELAKASFTKRGFIFDQEKTRSGFEQIKTLYSKANLAAVKGRGSSNGTPIFIVAMPRSGTTLLEQVISSHSEVFGAGELPLGNAAAQKLIADLAKPTPQNLIAKLTAGAKDYAHLYLDYLPEKGPGETRLSDKMPNNFMHLGFLQTVLPKASYIYIKRHPLDICLSIYKGFFGSGFTYALDLEDLGFYYRQHHALMAHWREALPLPILEVRYEEFVADPEGQGKRILEHCGLEWQPECLEFHKRRNKVITMSSIQVREPVHQKAVDKWRRYEKHLEPLLKGLGDDIVKTLDL